MRTLIALISVGLCAAPALAGQTLRLVSWREVKDKGNLPAGKVVELDDGSGRYALKVKRTEQGPATLNLLTIENPGVTANVYALSGQVRYKGVAGKGYLEMWSFLPGRGRHFTRTLAGRGPMRHLQGSSGWRRFVLPFYLRTAPKPDKLTLNLVLPGPGEVELGPLTLAQYAPSESPLAVAGAWWSERAGGLFGAIVGVLGGCLGATIGALTSRGRARGLVMGLMTAALVAGVALLALGLTALLARQPYAVWYPPLLSGVLFTVLMASLLPVARKRYRDIELRKINAMDAS